MRNLFGRCRVKFFSIFCFHISVTSGAKPFHSFGFQVANLQLDRIGNSFWDTDEYGLS